nr:retrovirus-related Pol polyprotein from transposon TNT 1-94 [Tanacetum cinerariifolium]
ETRSEAYRTFDFRALDFQITQLTEKVLVLQEQNKPFRIENAKVKQHYKELYESIKITHAKHIDQTTSLLTKNENLKVQINVKLKRVTIDSVTPKVLAPATIHKIVEEARVERPLDRSLASACMYTKRSQELVEYAIVQIILSYLDSSCSKHMTGDRSRLMNFMKKFIETVRFGRSFGAIMGYGDYVIGESVISRVYYVEGLGHNLFSIGQFYDSDLEVAFMKHSCYVQDTDGVELIKGSCGSNLYTILVEDMIKSSLICLLSKASKTKSWLWHRCLTHLNFGTINDLARKDLVRGLPRLKFEKDHLYSACQLGKSKKHTHSPKTKNTNLEVLNTLHMDLCGPMRVQTINGKKYILVIFDDYTRLNKTVRFIRTDNGTEFVNHDLTHYYKSVGIFHQKSVPRTLQQNGVVERRNRTLVEAARIITGPAPSFTVSVHISSGLALHRQMASANNTSGPAPQRKESLTQPVLVAAIQELVVSTSTHPSTRIDQDAPSTSTSQTIKEAQSHVIPTSVEEYDNEYKSDAKVAEKQARNVQTSLTLSSAKLEIQSMVNVPIHQEDPSVQRNSLIDTVILMVTDKTASILTPPTTQAQVQMCSTSYWKTVQENLESFVSGHVRDIDYRLIQRIE